ncbi:MAG: hypothetical protein WBD03_02495, partial [Thermoplasmata archaeon]
LEAQLFSRASKLGLTIGEIPISYGERCGDVTKLSGISSGARIFWTLVRERVIRNHSRASPVEAPHRREMRTPSYDPLPIVDD